MRKPHRPATTVCFLLSLAGCSSLRSSPSAPPSRLTHGAAVGEVTATSATAWGRCDRAATFHVQLDGTATPAGIQVRADDDFTGKIVLTSLQPRTAYRYRAWCGDDGAAAVTGSFRTAPAAGDAVAVRLLWGGDVGGQNVCRDAEEGYFIFDRLRERQGDAFIALGDMIYADDGCAEIGLYGNRQVVGPGPSDATAPSFWEHWRYNRADPASQRFFLSTSYYAVWDDHEISNDAGPLHDTLPSAPNDHRFAGARRAFVDWQPLLNGKPFYRGARWGSNAEMFILDTRSYRELNTAPDTGPQPKTMLGAEQRRWLVDGLAHSDATWKIVVSSVPMSVPTGGDGWANYRGTKGFERELLDLLAAARAAGVRNMVWITTDIHFATGFRYTPFPGDHVLEFTSGPLNAGMFPKQDLDETLHPQRLFFYGGPPPEQSASFAEARPFFNFGELDVQASGELVVRIINSEGAVVWEGSFTAEK